MHVMDSLESGSYLNSHRNVEGIVWVRACVERPIINPISASDIEFHIVVKIATVNNRQIASKCRIYTNRYYIISHSHVRNNLER